MKRIVLAVLITAFFVGCTSNTARGPLSPSGISVSPAQQISWACFTDPESCGMSGASVTSADLAPGPINVAVVVIGSTVTLSWQPPPGVSPTGYILEAGSAAGLTNIAMLILSSATSISVGGVPSNTYFVRVRAIVDNCCGTAPSNEVVVTVGTPPPPCTPVLSPTSAQVPAAGGTVVIGVTSTCPWTAITNAPFLTITSGSNGIGNGSVTVQVAANSGSNRTGVVTVAGQSFVINQDSASISASFILEDPGAQSGATTECRFKGNPTTCFLRSTSFPRGRNALTTYAWTVVYTYGVVKTITQTETSGVLAFSDVCGGDTSAPEGPAQPLSVTMKVTDNNGETATAISGQGAQPPLSVRLFTCGP